MKDIKGYEGQYAITSCGKVWSYKTKRFLKPKVVAGGYLSVSLCKNAIKESRLIHRLVAEAYIDNPNNYPQVSHKDENSTHNWLNNLEWADAKINCNMPEHKKRKSKSLMNNATSRKVLCIETDELFPSLSEAARKYGCSPQNIYTACKDDYRTACGYHWRYADE